MQPRFVTRRAFTVVGVRLLATPISPEILQLWPRFVPRINEIEMQAEPHVAYGVMNDVDPDTRQFHYLAGVAVASSQSTWPLGMTRVDVPAGEYAVFVSTLPDLGRTFAHIFEAWLPTSGRSRPPAPYLERYGPTFDPADPASVVEIFIPVTPTT